MNIKLLSQSFKEKGTKAIVNISPNIIPEKAITRVSLSLMLK